MRTVLILGMHRSGTSCLTGMLEQAGLPLGEVNTVSRHNRKGNRENNEVMRLNDAVLAASGGGWDQPPAALRWDDGHRAERDRLIGRHREQGLWGLKDPRMLLVLPFWREGLAAVTLVGTVRHPLAVARSLEARSGIDIATGVALWQHYATRLLDLWGDAPFPLLRFDWPAPVYCAAVRETARRIGLSAGPIDFYEPELHHHHGEDSAVPGTAGVAWETLRAISERYRPVP